MFSTGAAPAYFLFNNYIKKSQEDFLRLVVTILKCHIGRVASLYLQGETFCTKLLLIQKVDRRKLLGLQGGPPPAEPSG
jgi:hypothetical protein